MLWFRSLEKRPGAHARSACLEESLHAIGTAQRYHLHGYLYWKGGDGFIRRNTDDLVFQSVQPQVQVCTVTNPARLQSAAHQGLYYVYIMKDGTIVSSTNFKPWRNFVPKAAWVDAWWAGHKLTHAQYIKLSLEFRGGHAGRLRDWEAVTRGEKERAIEDHLEKELKAIKKKCPELPMRDFLVATQFVKLFGEARWRRPILAIVGGTNLGKSVLAAKVLGDVASLVGVPSFLEVTVEGDLALDLSEFGVAKHAGVLLDGVGDAMMLKSHREVLQGRPKVCRGGKSATMMYSYPFTLCRRAVVTTMDLSAKSLHLLSTDHCLSTPTLHECFG